MQLVSAASSGVFDSDWTWGPIDAPGECLFCENSVQLHYEDGVLWLTCGDDEHDVGLSIAPSLLASQPDAKDTEAQDEDVDALIERIAFLENRWGELTRRGICSECQGYVAGSIECGGRPP